MWATSAFKLRSDPKRPLNGPFTFNGLDEWKNWANNPTISVSGTGASLSGGNRSIFWDVRALIYLAGDSWQSKIDAIENASSDAIIEVTDGINQWDEEEKILYWDSSQDCALGNPDLYLCKKTSETWHYRDPLVILGHEMEHAYRNLLEGQSAGEAAEVVGIMAENVFHQAFYEKIPLDYTIDPRPSWTYRSETYTWEFWLENGGIPSYKDPWVPPSN